MLNINKYHNGQSFQGAHENNFTSSPYDSGTSPKEEKDLDLKQILLTLWNRKWIILSTTFVCGFIATILAFTATPIYESDGSMLIQNPQGTGSLGGNSGIGQLLSSSYGLGAGSTLANELQVLRSRKLSSAVADTLIELRLMPNDHQYPILFKKYPEDSTIISLDTVASRIRGASSFNQVLKKADVVNVTFQSPSPQEAAHGVNLIMDLYKELSTRQNRSSANSAVSFLANEKDSIENDLRAAESRLREFMNSSDLVQVDAQTRKLIEQMAELESKKQEAKAKLVAVNSAINQYEERINEIKPGLADKYSEAIGPNISRLQYAKAELELQKEQLLARNPNLENDSPQLAELNQEINSYKSKIRQLTENLINENDQYLGFLGDGGVAESITEINQKLIELQVQQEQYQSQIDVVDTQLQEQERFFENLPDNIIDLARLKRDVTINEELYITVSRQYAETALWEQTQFGMGRIIDRAYIPKLPVRPYKKLYVLIGLIIGLILSCGYVLLRDTFNTTIMGVERLRKFKEPVLAVIPTMNDYIKDNYQENDFVTIQNKKVSTGLVTVLDSISPISESFRRLQNNLIYSNPDEKLNSIMITSSAKGEGKTTAISNLGVVLADAGYKTLIVDTDLRRPNLHNMFGLSKKPGFMDILFNDLSSEDAIQQTILSELFILSSGRKPPNAAAITQSKAFLNLLESLEKEYDFVLIDTPPFGIITDASAMLRQSDAVAVVARFGETSEVQLSQTLEQLHRLHANVAGTILTDFDHTQSNDLNLSSSYYNDVYKDYNSYQEDVRV